MNDAEEMEVEVQESGDATILRPIGEVDLSRAPFLRVQLSQVQERKPNRIIVDLEGVPYMDSSGVATLVEALGVARRQGNTFVLCALQDKVRSIFEIARLDMVFTIRSSVEEALGES